MNKFIYFIFNEIIYYKKNIIPLPKIITIIGPESTGKSALTIELAQLLNATIVPEYAREYIASLHRPYDYEDLLIIAQNQNLMEQEAIKYANADYIILDTNLEVLKVWSEHSFNNVHHFILDGISRFRCDLYLLMNIDMPWEYDPQREHPSVVDRKYFYNIYKDIVINSDIPFEIISGIGSARTELAMEIIKKYFNI